MQQKQKNALPDFMLDADPTVRWPVTVELPADGGQKAEFRFFANIRVLPDSGYDALEPAKSETPPGISEVLQHNARILPQLVTGWSGIRDASGPVPIERLPQIIQESPYGRALSKGLWRAVAEVRFGLDAYDGGAALGNSETSPADGLVTPAGEATN